jgi:predicted transcriptional regulator|tara:strand:- start:249 stop:431 length:183 start_codon:yes stop_codon:yes gene_type:complete
VEQWKLTAEHYPRASKGRGMAGMKLNNSRSNFEKIANMLRLGEAGKTEIMYSANMSYFQL